MLCIFCAAQFSSDVLCNGSTHMVICFGAATPKNTVSMTISDICEHVENHHFGCKKIHMYVQHLLNVRTADHGQTCWQLLLNTCLRMCCVVGHHMPSFVLRRPHRNTFSMVVSDICAHVKNHHFGCKKIHMYLQHLLNVRTADHGQTCWQLLLITCSRMCCIVGHHLPSFVFRHPHRIYLLNGRL